MAELGRRALDRVRDALDTLVPGTPRPEVVLVRQPGNVYAGALVVRRRHS